MDNKGVYGVIQQIKRGYSIDKNMANKGLTI